MCHVEWSKVVDAHSDLKVFLGSVVGWYENACIVDQYVQRRPAV